MSSATRPLARSRRPPSRRTRQPSPPSPIGNGPFMMAEPVGARPVHQGRQAFADYYGTKPQHRRHRFQDLQRSSRPRSSSSRPATSTSPRSRPGRSRPPEAEYGTSDERLHRQPRQTGPARCRDRHLLPGPSTTTDELFKNADLRQAVSLAINRQAICDTVMEGTRVPADSIIPPGIVGYEAGAWPYSQVRRRSRQSRSGQSRLSRRRGPARA